MNVPEISSGIGHSTVLLKNPHRAIPLEKSELNILAILNTELKLNLDLESQNKLEALKIIGKEVGRKLMIDSNCLHHLGISLRSLGNIYLKLQGFSSRVDPLGSFGAHELMFG